MTKDEFIARFQDEMIGLLLASFAGEQETAKFADGAGAQEKSDASKGRFMVNQMKRARDLLGRMHAEMQTKTNGPVVQKPIARTP